MKYKTLILLSHSINCAQTTRTLRIYLSHTVSDQAWQTAATDSAGSSAGPDPASGRGIPAWALKIEGRLLEPTSRVRDRAAAAAAQKRFSELVRHLVVDLERDPNLYPDGNAMEVCWCPLVFLSN